LPQTRFVALRIVVMVVAFGLLVVGARAFANYAGRGKPVHGMVSLVMFAALAFGIWRLRYWALRLSEALLAAAILVALATLFPMFERGELPPVSAQLPKFLLWSIPLVSAMAILSYYRSEFVRRR
jgi:hypothetical protein